MSRIYLNAASHGLPSRTTLKRVRAHLDLECEIGPFAAAEQAQDAIAQVYEAAAQFIGAPVEDVALSSTTTATLAGLLPGVVKSRQTVLVAPQEPTGLGKARRGRKGIAASRGWRLER
jgi:selenocysteine lyase/cysteine desulfurase